MYNEIDLSWWRVRAWILAQITLHILSQINGFSVQVLLSRLVCQLGTFTESIKGAATPCEQLGVFYMMKHWTFIALFTWASQCLRNGDKNYPHLSEGEIDTGCAKMICWKSHSEPVRDVWVEAIFFYLLTCSQLDHTAPYNELGMWCSLAVQISLESLLPHCQQLFKDSFYLTSLCAAFFVRCMVLLQNLPSLVSACLPLLL